MPAKGAVYFQAASTNSSDVYQFERPLAILEAARPDEAIHVLAEVERQTKRGFFAAGYVAYEAASAFEPAVPHPTFSAPHPTPAEPRRTTTQPYAWFGIYKSRERISRAEMVRRLGSKSGGISDIRFSIPRSRYRKQIGIIRELIHEGDIYQINYSGQLRFSLEGPPEALFADLVAGQSVPYAAYIDTGEIQILSCSPELFFRREGSHIITRPMKGTAVRGTSRLEDERIERQLARDEKNRAENLMIVDLLRNDLSRCCRPGSVNVSALFETERYETLFQMTSQIEGELLPQIGLTDIFRALFPCGSVTGAPKIRAMQRIDELEEGPRGPYCGAIGFVEPGGRSVFNVAIRTAVIRNGVGRLGIGSGVVWDSDADAEYEECLLKGKFLTGEADAEPGPFYLIETMRAEGGAIPLLELHLDRLAASADWFGIPFTRSECRERTIREAGGAGCLKIRLTLSDDGAIHIASTAIASHPATHETAFEHASGQKAWRCTVSAIQIDSQDPLRRHKTSIRALYSAEFESARDRGYDEVVFFNEHGELCEGSRSNIFIRNGRNWRTPPIESGVLPGVYRRHLIAMLPNVSETTLRIDDIVDAEDIYLCNAVIGLMPAQIEIVPPVHTSRRNGEVVTSRGARSAN